MSGPLDPNAIQKQCLNYTPSAARFVLEMCVERNTKLDGDTLAILFEIAKTDKPDWRPRTAEQIRIDSLVDRGVKLPEARPDPLVEEKETEVADVDEEERPL